MGYYKLVWGAVVINYLYSSGGSLLYLCIVGPQTLFFFIKAITLLGGSGD